MNKYIFLTLLATCLCCVTSYAQYVPQYRVKEVEVKPVIVSPAEYKPASPTYKQTAYNNTTQNNSVELGNSWEVVKIYKKIKMPTEIKALNSSNDEVKNIEYLLSPTDLDDTNYKITIRSINKFLYEVVGQDYCIEIVDSFESIVMPPCGLWNLSVQVVLKKEALSWVMYEIK